MQMKERAAVRTALLVGVACLATASTAGAVISPAVKCQQAIAKAAGKYAQDRAKFLELCELGKIKAKLPAGTVCTTETKTLENLTKSAATLSKAIASGCGGKDKICGTSDVGEVSASSIGYPSVCQNVEGGSCNNAISHCGDIAQCQQCLADAATDQTNALYHADLIPTDPKVQKVTNACQQAISKEAAKFLQAKSKALVTCWDQRLLGKHSDVCPDGSNPDPKSAPRKAFDAIAKAEATKVKNICKACGGADKLCDGVADVPVASIGFTPTCTNVQVPGGQNCGGIGAVSTVDKLVQCVDCVTEYHVDVLDGAAHWEFPSTCTTAVVTVVTSFTPPSLPDFVAGVQTNVSYPGPKLDIPGSGGSQQHPEILTRVTNLTGLGGTFSASDNNLIPDSFDDSLSAGLLFLNTPGIPAGNFVKLSFDCRAGAQVPTLADFSCSSDVSDFDGSAGNGGTLTSSCQVTNLVTTP
jgi:hypothetical protein